jgi:transcription antitermination factor NusG
MQRASEYAADTAVGAAVAECAVDARPCSTPERLATLPGDWWVLHTKARSEKRIASVLTRGGVAHYLPVIGVTRSYAKSTHDFELPLFPGYLFLRGGRDACNVAVRTNRVANVLAVRDPERLQNELIQIGRAIESGSPVELFATIHTGRPYRIICGPMKGVVGVVVRRGRRTQMCLAVTMLGQSAMVEVDAALLAPAD